MTNIASSKEAKKIWSKYLSQQRLGATGDGGAPRAHRSPFDKDYDRIIFSSAFRRLQDKTQVFPLSRDDYTRTRLTHSLEVASVGRSLGNLTGEGLSASGRLPEHLTPSDIGTLVATACLAHDVGNPPFGHAGEEAIQAWAKRYFSESGVGVFADEGDSELRRDFTRFEGNAQTFRVYARLQGRERRGGIRLTMAAYGALIKYPVGSDSEETLYKKWGYFRQDKTLAHEVFAELGQPVSAEGIHRRHPLAYLMEAADDICYAVIDLEDGYRRGILTLEEVLEAYAGVVDLGELAKYEPDTRVNIIRAKVIGELIHSSAEAFASNIAAIETGELGGDLIGMTPHGAAVRALKKLGRERIYVSDEVLQLEISGFQALGGLLGLFASALIDRPEDKESRKLQKLFPSQYLRLKPEAYEEGKGTEALLEDLGAYERLLAITDYVSGMTDSFAVNLYQTLSGIRLPQ